MFIFYFVYTKHQVLPICNENKEICVANLRIKQRFYPLKNKYFGVFILNGFKVNEKLPNRMKNNIMCWKFYLCKERLLYLVTSQLFIAIACVAACNGFVHFSGLKSHHDTKMSNHNSVYSIVLKWQV